MATREKNGEEFVILPVQLPPLPSFPVTAVHEIRVRRNAPKIPTANDSRSLFLKNVPADSTEPHFRAVFASLVGAGRFETVDFEGKASSTAAVLDPARAMTINSLARKRKRGDVEDEGRRREEEEAQLPDIWTRKLHASSSTAVVLLADEKSVQLVLKAIAKVHKSHRYPVWGEGLADDVPPLGAPWLSSHLQLSSRADKLETKKSVHAFFNTFNRKEKEAAELAKRLRNEPDEDGFVTVTRGSSRVAPASRDEAEDARRKMIEKDARKKDGMQDFYRFQLRQRRKDEQASLIKRFEEDRKKVDAMREKRGKFRPET
ncbi:ribosomal RNA-processing protein 7 [Geosmithia morbida]|uniref:Ribosomal RNA-processing protein 7 n=1 Tax=Geosmithia morbida TaxID=1094350 RepID=A0A9P4YYZ2_9HYPO|nr:ribosomal RNA-processing protein 7 [Geosmithia morbida]KAF4124243.1 ribosomal RNA-processing protein 7 [Geosmithia morbida]